MQQSMYTVLHSHRRWVLLFLFLTLCWNLGYAGIRRFYPATGVGSLVGAYNY